MRGCFHCRMFLLLVLVTCRRPYCALSHNDFRSPGTLSNASKQPRLFQATPCLREQQRLFYSGHERLEASAAKVIALEHRRSLLLILGSEIRLFRVESCSGNRFPRNSPLLRVACTRRSSASLAFHKSIEWFLISRGEEQFSRRLYIT